MLDEVEFVLADARERAQRIIDESMERARDLIRQERAAAGPVTGIDPRAFDDLRRGLRGLVTEVRDIQQRLSRIEALLREQNERDARREAPAAAPAYGPAYEERVDGGPAVEPAGFASGLDVPPAAPAFEPAAAWGAPVPPRAPVYEPEVSPTADEDEYADEEFEELPEVPPTSFEPVTSAFDELQEELPAAPPAPAAAPPRSTFSVVPPQRREWAPTSEPAAAEDLDELPEEYDAGLPPHAPAAFEPVGISGQTGSAAPEPEWEDVEYGAPAAPAAALSSSPLVTFLPSDGAITLRVAPVAGFQGLMRIQDALTRLPAVRHASVEAYSQGEARLRIELADTSDSDEIAAGLARALRGPARVEDASEVNRELLIALR